MEGGREGVKKISYSHAHTRTLQVGNYTDKAIEQLIPLSEISGMADQKDVCDIFYDTLREDPRSRPSALQLLGYPALVNGEKSLLSLYIIFV